jgi:uncharacterized protein YcbK (DUF882 family)
MLTITELLSGNLKSKIPKEHFTNLMDLLVKINTVRTLYAKTMTVTSGYRSLKHHTEIYADRGILTPPLGSKHLTGQAVDISDPDGKLMLWVKANYGLMETFGLWMEEPDNQKRVHFQSVPPKSGKRFFYP